jgi:hypothetical protein
MICRSRHSVAVLVASVLLVAGFFCATAVCAQAQQAATADVLFGALVMATTSEHPQPAPEGLQGQAKNLEEVFGYNDFKVLGEKRKTITTGKEDWLVPSRQFFLRVDTKHAIPGGYEVGLQLLQQDRVMVEAEAKLSRERPLFIRGPFVGQGQLLILLMVL